MVTNEAYTENPLFDLKQEECHDLVLVQRLPMAQCNAEEFSLFLKEFGAVSKHCITRTINLSG